MKDLSSIRWGILALALVVGPVGISRAQDSLGSSSAGAVKEGFTEPSQNLKLAFYSAGIVKDIEVKEGDAVKKGQALIQEDDRIEQKKLEGMYGEAFSGLNVKASESDLAYKRLKREHLEKAAQADQAATEFELEEAKADEALAAARVELAKQDQAEKRAEYDQQKLKVELMKLRSPVDGRIQKLDVGLGEMAVPDPTKPAVEVVVNDPLWVKFSLPVEESQRLKVGDKVSVSHDGGRTWETATVNYLAPFASGGAGTQLVRAELANPNGRDSGLKVEVKLPVRVTAGTSGDPAAVTASSK